MIIKQKIVEYIKEKKEKSLIIQSDESCTLITANKEIGKIKEAINDLLNCTNLKEIQIQSKGRNIYYLNKEITKHILSTISNDYSKEKKREIIKKYIKEIINSKNNILIFLKKNGIIYILDTGIHKN